MLFFGEVVCKARAKLEALSCSFSGILEATLELRCEHASTCVSYSGDTGLTFWYAAWLHCVRIIVNFQTQNAR